MDYREVSRRLQALVPHELRIAPTDNWAEAWPSVIQLDPSVPYRSRGLLVVHEAAHLLDWAMHGPGGTSEDPEEQHDMDHGPSWGVCYAAIWRYLGGI